jgi:hypothetical protein
MKMNNKHFRILPTVLIIFVVLCLFSVNINVSALSQEMIDALDDIRDRYNMDDETATTSTEDTSTTAPSVNDISSDDSDDGDDIFEKLNKETPGVVVGQDNSLDFSESTGGTVLSKDEINELGVKKIVSKNEVINLGDADIEIISVKDGITKVTFAESDKTNEITFESNGNTYAVSAEKGTVEWIDGEMRFSEGVTIKTQDEKSFTSLQGGTKIKLGEITEIQGKASIEYKQDFLSEIKVIGKDSSLVIEKSENEKTEFTNIDGEDMIIKTGEFHITEDCEGNCISYKDMGAWSKAKIDGNALFVKSVGDETRTVRFEDKKVYLYSKDDLNPYEGESGQKTVINYNNEMPVIVKKIGEVETDRYELYDEENPKVVVNNQNTEIKETQNQKTQQTAEGQLTEFEKKAKNAIINGESLYEKVTEIYNQYDGEDISKQLFISLIEKESSMDEEGVYYYSYGLTQSTLSSLKDLILNEPNEYGKYKDYSEEELINLLKSDPEFNLNAGFDYLERIEEHYGKSYGFSEPKQTYNYDGDEVDIYLMAYNAGPTVTNKLMESFKASGGGDWEDLKAFINSNKGISILGKDKVRILPGYVDEIKQGAE